MNLLENTDTTIKGYNEELIKPLEKVSLKKYFEILERLKVNDKYFKMLLIKEVEEFYISKDRKDKTMAIKYNEFKEIMRRINFEKVSQDLVPSLKKVRDYFQGLKLLNQQTKNLINERN
jgi:hypothetical protein